MENLEKLMPSAQRKLMIKMEFERILSYYPHDVFYTLECGAEMHKKDLDV